MRPHCIWRDKVGKYTEDLVEAIYNKRNTRKVNVYAYTQIMSNCKNFKGSHTLIAKDLFSDLAIQHMTEMELLHFTECIVRKQFDQSVIKPFLEMCKDSSVLYTDMDLKKMNTSIQRYNQRNYTELGQLRNSHKGSLRDYFESEWDLEFDRESMLLKMKRDSSEVLVQGYDPNSWDQFKNALNILQTTKIGGLVIPMPAPEEDKDLLSYNLDDTNKYRLSEVHLLVQQRRFDLARPNGILTTAYKARNKGIQISPGLDKYSNIISSLVKLSDSRNEFEDLLTSNAADKCSYLKHTSKRGCNICKQDKNTPFYPHELIWYTSYTARSLFLRSIISQISSLQTKGVPLVLLDKYCLFEFVRYFLNNHPRGDMKNESMAPDSLGLWHSVFWSDK